MKSIIHVLIALLTMLAVSSNHLDYGNDNNYYKSLSNIPNRRSRNAQLHKLEIIDVELDKLEIGMTENYLSYITMKAIH